MRFDVITSFPEALKSYLSVSILRRAIERGLVSVRFSDPRDFADDRRRTIDSKPYGGGAGMVLMAEPILKAVGRLRQRTAGQKSKIIILSAKGRQFNQRMAVDLARHYGRIILISGRYEGIDERVRRILKADEVSVGPYVLTDGDAAAMVIISAVSRLIPGVIREESLRDESHSGRWPKRAVGIDAPGLEYPQYTRPDKFRWKGRTYGVPKILLSGDHARIARWRERWRRPSS